MAQGETSKPLKHLTSLLISPIQNRQLQISCQPAVTPIVTSDLPSQPVHPVGDLPHIMGLQLADPDYHLPGRIDILLGADMAPKIMAKQLLRDGENTQPIAQATHFGWVLSGPARRKNSSTNTHSSHPVSVAQPEPQLDHLLKRFWKSEEEPEDTDPSLSDIEKQVEEHFIANHVYLPVESRYQVSLPKQHSISQLGSSRPQALSRYLSNEKSIIRRDVWQPFQEVVQSYLDLGRAGSRNI